MSKAIYAFSGDPPTFGHLNIVERVAKTFDEVIVGIGVNPDKKYMFSLEERKQMSEKMFGKIPNVKVISFEGLLVNYAYENSIPNIIRGIRNTQDMEYEGIVELVGASQNLEIEVYYLFADAKLAHISSSAVKALQKESGFIHDYVPLHVKQALEGVMSNRYMLGVTGTIGVGKSYICNLIKKWCDCNGVPCTYIDLDLIAREILNSLTEPAYVTLREEINRVFPVNVLQEDGFIDRQKLGELVFEDNMYLELLNSLMEKPLLVRYVDALRKASGLVLVEAALFAEAGILNIVNNNVLLIDVADSTQIERLRNRKYKEEQIDRRINSQYTTERKFKKIQEAVDRQNHGNFMQYDPSFELSMEVVLKAVNYPREKIEKSIENWVIEVHF
jgi:pantetheine-phosphate adenylyltransferase